MDKPEPLSDDEIRSMWRQHGHLPDTVQSFGRAVERTVAARYEARIAELEGKAEQLERERVIEIDEARVYALEEAAAICDKRESRADTKSAAACYRLCARDIRALIGASAAEAQQLGTLLAIREIVEEVPGRMMQDELAEAVRALKGERDALRADAQGWMLIEEDAPVDVPLDTPVLLGWWRHWPEREWVTEAGLAGSVRGGWRHGRATHWRPLPAPPDAAGSAQEGS